MYSQKNFNATPLFSWPQLCPTGAVLEVGSLGGCSYGESTPPNTNWICMNEAQACHEGFDIRQITNVTQIFPHTRRHYSIPQYNCTVAKAYFAQSAQFLLNSYPEFDISQEYIEDTLFEESCNENDYKNFDPYMSHELVSVGTYEFNSGMIKKFISFPIGTSGTQLNFLPLFYENTIQDTGYNVSQYRPELTTLNFKTPIRQVSSSIYEITPTKNLDIFNYCSSLIAIRTMSGTSFLKIINSESELDGSSQVHLKAIVLDNILHQKENNFDHMHVTFNPMIYGEAAIIDGNGGIHLWKGERHEDYSKLFVKYDFTTVRTSQVDIDLSFKDLWKTCVYGAHPQTLFVASRTSADLFDFRSRDVTLLFDINSENKIFSLQRSPVCNSFEFILTTQNNVVLLDQRFPKRPMLMWAHHHISPPCGINITTREKTSIVLTWSKSPPTITAFQYLTSASGPIISTSHPVSIPSFITHPTYSRSKYLRSPYTMRDNQTTEGSFQQQKLPSLSSMLLLKNNNVTQKHADNLGSRFSILQLSQTGALYSQVFHASDKTDLFIRPNVSSNKFNLQISEMSDSISSLHNLADMDAGTVPELRVKQSQNLHFEELWNYIVKDFKCPSLNNVSPFVLKTGTLFISWKSVEKYFEHYGHVAGFNCQKKSIIRDVIGNVQSLTYACMEGKFFNKKNRKHKKIVPCEWQVTLSSIKSDGHIIITKFINRHNHELFSSLYYSERWRSDVIDNTNTKAISNIQSDSQCSNEKEIFMNFQENNISFVSFLKKFYHDNLWIVNEIGHPLTLYEILKNIPGLHINDLEIPRVQQFSETFKIKKNSLELSIEWSLFDINFLFEQLYNENLNSALTISQIYGFPNIDIIDRYPADIEKGFNYCLQKAYSLNFLNEMSHLTIDDQIKHSHQNAIDEISRDLVKCSQAFISKTQNCSKFSLSSDFLLEQSINELTNFSPFAIKCKRPIDIIGTSDKENDDYMISIAAQELFNDWIIGQNLKEYDYKFLDDFENLTEISIPINILEKSQEKTLFNDTFETKNPVAENITECGFLNQKSSLNISQLILNISKDTYQDTSLEKPKKKSRRSGFR